MASLLPSNVAVPAPIADTLMAMITQRSAFTASAAAAANLDAGARLGGTTFQLGRWKEDTTAAEVIDGSASTPGNVGSYADIGPILRRKRPRGIVDGVDAVLGELVSVSPSQAILAQAADYWAQQIDNSFVQSLTAMFDSSSGALRTTHRSSVAVASGTPVPLSYGNIVDAATLVGDNSTDLKIVIAHAKQVANLKKEAGAKPVNKLLGDRAILEINDMIILTSDFVPTSGSGTFKKYTAVMIRPGALYLAIQQAMREIVEINATVPEVRITQTLHWAPLVRGMAYGGAANPSDVTLATPGSWAKATSVDKEIGVVALETNAT